MGVTVYIKDCYDPFHTAHEYLLNSVGNRAPSPDTNTMILELKELWKEFYDIEIILRTVTRYDSSQDIVFDAMQFKDEAEYMWFRLRWA